MNDELMTSVASRWARLGVMINATPAEATPDIEQLLLDTVRVASANTRLFILATTWLATNVEYVARHRLAQFVRDKLDREHRPTLGLMLELAASNASSKKRWHLKIAIEACGSAIDARPLADVEQRNSFFARVAEQRASALSREWGRWIEDFDLKFDAIRPTEWLAAQNPALAERALTGGDLSASILAELHAGPRVIESEAEAARRCGASRPAIRDALLRLRMAGRIRYVPRGKSHEIQLCART